MNFGLSSVALPLCPRHLQSQSQNNIILMLNTKVSTAYQLWFELCCIIPMSQASVVSQSPSIQFTTGRDCSTVRTTTCNVTNTLRFQGLNQARGFTVPKQNEKVKEKNFNSNKCIFRVLIKAQRSDIIKILMTKPIISN